jgi:RES domain-containing protein
MAAWARMLSGAAGAPPLGVMLAVPERGAAVGANGDGASVELPEEDGAALSADERVARFYESASTLARELAWCLSAVPLSLPVMRLVQRAVLPESSQVHLAEVFLGGLLRRVTPKAEPVPPDDVQYDFHEGVRERLMDSLSGQRAMKVLEHVSELVGLKLGRREDFRAALLAPAGSEAPVQVSAAQRPFAVLMASVLRRFGPRYLKIIEVLERQAPEAPASTAVPGAQEAQHAPGAQPSWVTSVYGTFPLERVSTVPLNETYFRAISLRYAAKPFRRRAQVIPGRYHRTSWTLHLADSQITSVYEAQAFAFAAQQLAILPIHLHLKSVLDLRDETTLRTLGLTREELAANFRNLPAGTQTKTQALGEQCVASGRIDGILYPSLAYEPGTLLVVFVDNLKRLGSYLEFTDPPTGKKLRLPERR